MKNINENISHLENNNFITLILITTSYWFFMLSDGALRMLILLYFYKLGFSPITLAYIFLLYEFLGMITNLSAGWIAKNLELNPSKTINRSITLLIIFPTIIATLSFVNGPQPTLLFTIFIVINLLIFGFFFALNSSLHSYLILLFSSKEKVTLNVGFYYMSNASGRLLGTLLSGISFQIGGLTLCLFLSSFMLVFCLFFSKKIIMKEI